MVHKIVRAYLHILKTSHPVYQLQFITSKRLQRKSVLRGITSWRNQKNDYHILHCIWKAWRDKSNGVTRKSWCHIFRPDSNKTAARRVYIPNLHIDILTTCYLATGSSLSRSTICQLSIHSIITLSLLRSSRHIRTRNCDTSMRLHKLTTSALTLLQY